LLPDPAKAAEVPSYQPFFLHALAQTLELMGDEDCKILTGPGESYENGLSVGWDAPIAPAPLVFRPAEKQKRYDDSEFHWMANNYSSAVEAADQLTAQFEKEEVEGMMYPLSEGAAKARFGDRLLVAAQGAIPKPDGTVRAIHDATHTVKLNNAIQISDRLEFPGPHELAAISDLAEQEKPGLVLSLCMDISKAHRRFKHREEDHGLLCCKADSSTK
ncbi:unnamed protein product, partial [Effrenium voratum]